MVALSRPSSAAAQRRTTPQPQPMDVTDQATEEQVDAHDVNFKRLAYYKKPPLAFLLKKDWQLFVRFMQQRPRISPISRQRTKRMLYAFHSLYQEYCYVCDKLLPPTENQMVGAADTCPNSSAFSSTANDATCSGELREPSPEFSICEQVKMSSTAIDHMQYIMDRPASTSSNGTYPRRHRGVFGPLFRSARQLLPHRGHCIYDRIHRCSHTPIDIYSRYRMRQYRGNYVLMKRQFPNSPQMRQILVQVPIALELLMPKIQGKIEKIMRHCPFLRDPLEVAAELRHFNYSVSRSITHFNNTRRIRCIIEEFLPVTGDSSELEKSWLNIPIGIRTCGGDMTDPEEGTKSLPKAMTSNTAQSLNNSILLERHHMNDSVRAIHALSKEVQVSAHPNENNIVEAITASFTQMQQLSKLSKSGDLSDWSIFNIIKALVGLKVSQEALLEDMENMRKDFGRSLAVFATNLKIALDRLVLETLNEEHRLQIDLLQRSVEELKNKCRDEECKRRHVYNLMQEQLGNVRVYCRLRNIDDTHSYLLGDNDRVHVLVPPMEEFRFDKVFPANYRQAAVFDAVVPLVTSFIDGYNVCFITYGGEASGKTYTLFGGSGSDQIGLVQRSLAMVLAEKESRKVDWDIRLSAVLIEIYNDVYNDFLGDKQNVHLYIDQGLEEVFKSLKSVPINSEGDVEALVKVCRHRRQVAKTALNPASSRSHLVTLVRLNCSSNIHGEVTRSFLALCDLAGFEDIIKAETQSNPKLTLEASHINRSLTAFNRVFVALRKQDPQSVPYRDAKLTHFLKPFLINSGKCCLIITARSDKKSLCCSQNTLRFGRETRSVTLGKAKRQINLDKYMT